MQTAHRFWTTFVLFLALSLAHAAQAPTGMVKKFPIGSQGELQLTLPSDWTGTLKPARNTVEVTPGSGNAFKILISVVPATEPVDSKSLNSIVQRMSGPAVVQSVEKKADIKPLKGPQAEGCYYSLTDSAPAPGEFTYLSQGLAKVSEIVLSFTILSNDPTQKIRDAGLDIIRSAVHLKGSYSAELEIPIPGQDWTLRILNPGLGQLQKQAYANQFICKSTTADGFNLSLFVEKPSGKGTQHTNVFDHYWTLAKRNPLIDPESIKVEKTANFVKVRYTMASMPHVNYYFAHKGRWIDLHISKLPFTKDDETLFASFDKAIAY